jgi:uracil-DNA glycosylase family 4
VHLQNEGRATSTISRNLASIRSFYQYLVRMKQIEENPTTGLESPKLEKTLPTVLSVNEINLLLEQPKCVDLKGFRDRPPEKDEVSACSWILLEQINIIRPKIIVTLGNPATKFLLNTEIGITKMRGTFNYFHDIPVIPTYHPSYILRNDYPGSTTKRETWEDIKKVIKFLSGNTNNEKA